MGSPEIMETRPDTSQSITTLPMTNTNTAQEPSSPRRIALEVFLKK